MPQLNPEFFVSQLFWLVVTFTFLLFFLWKISLPRISSVLERRENKINNEIETAKQLHSESEKIQNQIEEQLYKTREKTNSLIKKTTTNLQNKATDELVKIDNELNKKINEFSLIIEKNKKESLNIIHEQTYEITKLALRKITSISINDKEIKEFVIKYNQKFKNNYVS